MAKAEKKVKEVKIAVLPPVEDAPKKRGRKPKAEIVSHETVEKNIQQDVKEAFEDAKEKGLITAEVAEELLVGILSAEVNNLNKKELSKQAAGWRDWLKYQRMTPDDFLKRYPTHKMIHFIKEIIEFNAQK